MKKVSLLVLMWLITIPALADFDAFRSNDRDFDATTYFEVRSSAQGGYIDLLNLKEVHQQFPLPTKPYNREADFGEWLKDPSDDTCLNTRGKVLVRDSSTETTLSTTGCTVARGTWHDPYTGRSFRAARDIQIDHLVALKHAYMSGAFEWDANKRCLYANYMGNEFHLRAVSARENMQKSDHSPAHYVPPNREYTCQFIQEWLSVKVIWALRVNPTEKAAIEQVIEDNNCDRNWFYMSTDELREQRDFMRRNANLCRR